MKNRRFSFAAKALIAFGLITLCSCNRGYGCPYDFSVVDAITNVLGIAFKVLNFLT